MQQCMYEKPTRYWGVNRARNSGSSTSEAQQLTNRIYDLCSENHCSILILVALQNKRRAKLQRSKVTLCYDLIPKKYQVITIFWHPRGGVAIIQSC